MSRSLNDKLAALSPEKRAALLYKLQKAKQEERSTGVIRKQSRTSQTFPLSFTQQRLWFLDQLEPGNPFYHLPSSFRLIGQLNIDALRSALQEMAQRHESLRTSFAIGEEGEPVQRVAPSLDVTLRIHDIRELPDEARKLEERRLLDEDVQRPCDLSNDPLWWASLIRVQDEESLLILTMHHIVFDLWSLGIFVRELASLYDAYATGRSASLPELPVQYVDYACYMKDKMQGEILEQQLGYWKRHLSGSLPILELPADRPRPPVQTFRGAFHTLILPTELYESVKKMSRELEATLFMTFLAAFKILLHRYTAQEDIIVGFPISGRNVQEIEGLCGVFVNSLPLRSDLSGDPSFREFVKHVRQTALGAYENQDVPFDMLVDVLKPERNLSHNPLFQVLFTYQTAMLNLDLVGLKMLYESVDGGTSKFDLSLDIYEGPEGPTCIFEYNTDLYDPERIERLAAHFQTLLQGIVADPDQKVADLPLLTESERQMMLVEWNDTAVTAAMDRSVCQLFEEQSEQTPHQMAVVYEGEGLTYQQLNKKANQLAHHLRRQGVGPEVLVGISVERSLDMIVGVLAILKAGGAYVPLDPAYPTERLAYMLDDADVAILLTHAHLMEKLPESRAKVVFLDADREQFLQESVENVVSGVTGDHLAYVIYTSGTTGNPKGTMITHGSLTNAYRGWETSYQLREASTSHLQMASFSFDVFTGDWVRALCSGGKLVLCSQDTLLDAQKLYQLMVVEQVNCAEFVPAVLRNLIQHLEDTQQTLDFMRVLVIGSDGWYVHEYQKFQEYCAPSTRLINSYGMTEVTIDSTYFDGSVAGLLSNQLVPIGRAFANTELYVLDAHLQPVPIGVPGELYIGGAGLARGYLNRPELTAEKFVNHPFRIQQGARLYKTGDVAFYLPDGNLVLAGRSDDQVKLRGFRIELGEIETVLGQHPLVRQCVVIAREDNPGDKRLVAYVVPTASEPLQIEGLRQFLKGNLPDYMVPSFFVALDAVPLTANGKVDRRSLPAVDTRTDLEGSYMAPRTLNEEMLAEIWEQAFGVRRISIHGDFFQLGGHSLLAIQIVSQIRKVFQVDIPLQTLFQAPTVAGLAAEIAQRSGGLKQYEDSVISLPALVPDPTHWHEPFPLTEVQQAYWIGRSDAFEMGNVSTHSYDELEFENLNLENFTSAWQHLIKRHGMLRAIVQPDGTQQILEQVPEYEIQVLDLRDMDEERTEQELLAVRQRMSHQILQTDKWPVFELRITLVTHDRARIHLGTDALMFDAWSYVLMLKELWTLYVNPQAQLPSLDMSFRDYVFAEAALKDSEPYKCSQKYWQERIPTLPAAPELPMIKSPNTLDEPFFTRLYDELDKETWRRLKAKATRMGLTASGVLLAAYAEVLTMWSKSPNFCLNLTFLKRLQIHPHVNEMMGEFTSLTLLEVDNSVRDTFAKRAIRLQENLWNDLEHQHVGGIEVLREMNRLQGGVTQAKMPVVFTSALTLPIPDQEETPYSMKTVYSITQTSQVWLDCAVWEDQKILRCNWDVVLELFPEGLLQDMFAAYFDLLHRLADDDHAWHELTLVTLPEPQLEQRMQVNQTQSALSSELLHTLFEQQAAKSSQQPAVITAKRTLTYEELEQRSNRIGRYLRQLGAKPNQLVAVVMEKGWQQVAATLGVLKSGAAYLPIDPSQPQERIDYLLAHGDVQMVLTQSWVDRRLTWSQELQRLSVDVDELLEVDTQPLDVVQTVDDLAYVIFTSGSTGLPKGVMIDHRGAVNTILDVNSRFGVMREDRVFALSALHFDLSVYDIFGALSAGAAIVMPDAEDRRDPAQWMQVMEETQVTVWNSVPALMGMLVEYAAAQRRRLPESLRLVLMSGDWIPTSMPGQIESLTSGVQLISMGGATEASIWSILYPIESVDPSWTSIPYGRPMANQTFYVFNDALEHCPTHVPGQLYIGGIGLAKGYWRDEEKTNTSFIVHPKTGERIYRTGDLGCYLPDGTIEFIGRADFQVKIQGYRIELGDIEAALAQHPNVRDAVVIAVGEKSHRKLAAYLVTVSEPLDQHELRAFLQTKLPEYMIPSVFVQLETLPLTANGKVDRKGLPSIDPSEFAAEHEFVAPNTKEEKQIAALWSEVLGVETVGIYDNFFALGGDSLLAVRMMMRLHEHCQVDVPLRVLFETPTIFKLAQHVSTQNVLGEARE